MGSTRRYHFVTDLSTFTRFSIDFNQSQLDLDAFITPKRPRSKWAQDPSGPGPKWAKTQVDPGPIGLVSHRSPLWETASVEEIRLPADGRISVVGATGIGSEGGSSCARGRSEVPGLPWFTERDSVIGENGGELGGPEECVRHLKHRSKLLLDNLLQQRVSRYCNPR